MTTFPSERAMDEIVDELARAWVQRGMLVVRLQKCNERLARANAETAKANADLADATARVNELRALASAGALGLDRKAA